jgi:type 1 glutamine amidotransferase
MVRWALILAMLPTLLIAEPKRVLYLTHSAGFRHDCLPVSQQVMADVAARTGKLEITATEDLNALNDLPSYSAVVFFTSGELALTDGQKQAFLNFIRNGGGFAGFHSATDTLYTWSEYGELIGGRFDGHPWVQEVHIDIEDPGHPATKHLVPSFSITDEIYQFRDFSRDRVRVLMTLDTSSVDVKATGVNRTDNDFALAWTRLYGSGRVFYTALGHFEDTWRDPRFQQLVEQSLLWITGQVDGEGQPRPAVTPAIAAIANAASQTPPMTISPGSLVSIYGANLTSGATMAGWSERLAGTRVLVNGQAARLLFASPGQINFYVSPTLESPVDVTVQVPQSSGVTGRPALARSTPGIFAVTPVAGRYMTIWATGLYGIASPRVLVNGQAANVLYSGPAPGFFGLDQINIELPQSAVPPFVYDLQP